MMAPYSPRVASRFTSSMDDTPPDATSCMPSLADSSSYNPWFVPFMAPSLEMSVTMMVVTPSACICSQKSTAVSWVFSVQPVKTDGWRYDAESRSGWVKLRIEDGISADEAKRWARDNISPIVADKNVLVGAGTPPPPGATYRSLGETFENGLLTVEFQAVQ